MAVFVLIVPMGGKIYQCFVFILILILILIFAQTALQINNLTINNISLLSYSFENVIV